VVIEVDEDVAVSISLLKQQRVRRADDVRLGILVCKYIKLLKRCVWSEQGACTEELERETHVCQH